MIIVTGHLVADPQNRDRLVELSQPAVSKARATQGCLDFSVSADPADPARVNVAERWQDRASMERFRTDGPEPEQEVLISDFQVEEYEVPGDTAAAQHADTADLTALVERRVAGVLAQDVDALLADYAEDVQGFGVLPPLSIHGRDAIRELTENWFAGYSTPIGYEVSDVRALADGDVGYVSFLYRVTGRLTAGDEIDMTVRATLGCQKKDGRWLIVHDHESVPLALPS